MGSGNTFSQQFVAAGPYDEFFVNFDKAWALAMKQAYKFSGGGGVMSLMCIQGGSVAEWLACWTQSQKARVQIVSRRCRVTVLGKLFTPIVPLFTKQQNW